MFTSSISSFGMPGRRTAGPAALPPVRRPARRLAAAFAATALAAGPALLLGAAPAQATGHDTVDGTSGAVVLRTGLDIGLLNKSVHVPLHVALNEVHAPASADKTALTVNLDGIDGGKPFSVLHADAATARAVADRHKTEGYAHVVHAKVQLPGLGLPLAEVQQVTAKAVCEAGQQPRAESEVLGSVVVLGKKVTLAAGGTTDVKVPGVGDVRLDLSKKSVTSHGAAATALDLNVAINPLKLNVAEISGRVTLVQATCTAPHTKAPGNNGTGGTSGGSDGGTSGGTSGGGDGGTSGGASGGSDAGTSGGKGTQVNTPSGTRPGTQNLAETGAGSTTPYLVGGAAVLLAAGAGAVGFARHRRNAAQGDRG
ncbi:SCO1860 family LAETG-anchored protein [Streptomyces celluloflavus]|uniref:SCO1860 family LAETG-anchored protein n=1 Tax=Streptomyces celluloflavus TaxID=58344 RepID=UPI0036DBFB51